MSNPISKVELPPWIMEEVKLLAAFNDVTLEMIIQQALVYYLHHENFGGVLEKDLHTIEHNHLQSLVREPEKEAV